MEKKKKDPLKCILSNFSNRIGKRDHFHKSYNKTREEKSAKKIHWTFLEYKKWSKWRKTGAVSLGLLVVLLGAIWIHSTFIFIKIDAEELYTVSFLGTNGEGSINVEFNTNSPVFKEKKFVENDKLINILSSVQFSISEKENLSNDDIVQVTVLYDKEEFAKNKIKLNNTSSDIIVSGLSEGVNYDVFSGISIDFQGYDGSGYAMINEENCDKFSSYFVEYFIKSNNGVLSNGDTVTVEAKVDEEEAKKYKYNISSTEKVFDVANLKSAKEYDLFQKLSLDYSGVSPKLNVSVNTSECEEFIKNNVKFTVDKTSNIKNGDTVIVTAVYDKEKLKLNGYEVTKDSKKFKVKNQNEYLTTQQGVKFDLLVQSVRKKIDDTLSNSFSNFFGNSSEEIFQEELQMKIKKISLEEISFGYNDEQENKNYLKLLGKFTISGVDQQNVPVKEQEVYVIITFNNLSVDANGNVSSEEVPQYEVSFEKKTLEEQMSLEGYVQGETEELRKSIKEALGTYLRE